MILLNGTRRRRGPVGGRINIYTTWPTTGGRNDFTGAVGFQFTVNKSMKPTRLGRHYMAGNTQDHQINIWWLDGSELISSATILAASPSDVNGYKWADCPGSRTLTPVANYCILVDETNGGDDWYDAHAMAGILGPDVNISGTAYTLTPGGIQTNGAAGGNGYDTAVWSYGNNVIA